MSNSGTTKTSSACTESLSNGEWETLELLRNTWTRILNQLNEQEKILPYRYPLMAMDLLSCRTLDEMQVMIDEFTIAEWEMQRVWLVEKRIELLGLIKDEIDEVLEASLWVELHDIDTKLEVLSEQWTMRTKYERKCW